MEAYIFRFTADELKKIESDTLGFLITSGHCCNELSALLPYIAFEYPLQNTNEVEAAFIMLRRYTIDRIIVSKIVEYDGLCRDFFRKKNYLADSFEGKLKSDYEEISNIIEAEKWARIMRNKASFHFDERHARESLADLEGSHPLRFIAGQIKGMTLFEFSEEIMSRPIVKAAGSGDIPVGMKVIDQYIMKALVAIKAFHSKSVLAAFKHFGLITEREKSELREDYCGAPGEDFVPLSISSAYISSRRSN